MAKDAANGISKGKSKDVAKKEKRKEKDVEMLPPAPVQEEATSSGSDSDDGEDDEDVTEEGMKRLMNALGEDGLDEVGQAQLQTLEGAEDEEGGDEDDSDWQSDDGEAGEVDLDGSEDGSDSTADNQDVEDDDDAVPLDDVSSVDEDVVPRQKIVINNKNALQRIRESIQLDPSLPWTETLTVTYDEPLGITDPDNDLDRELAFYKQALWGANASRTLAGKHQLPFTRPTDYFAEMVKSDAHMERIRQRLLDESAGIKKGEEAKKQRDLKKFGKQVQVEKLKEREKMKKDMQDRLKGLKRKRKDGLDGADDGEAFDVAIEDAISGRPDKKQSRSDSKSSSHRPKMPRDKRDAKFGFGGGARGGRRAKQNTRESTNNFEFSAGKNRGGGGAKRGGGGGGQKRLGKSRRQSQRSK